MNRMFSSQSTMAFQSVNNGIPHLIDRDARNTRPDVVAEQYNEERCKIHHFKYKIPRFKYKVPRF